MSKFSFTLEKETKFGRVGNFVTPHGRVETPIFMPVGTLATVKALDTKDIEQTQAQIILANTYHLYLRPGMERLQQQGGVHEFMRWTKPMLTDSGGFQVFSLGQQQRRNKNSVPAHGGPSFKEAKIFEHGVEFTSHLDGSTHLFTPEKAIELQRQIGADIIMAFDECTPDTASPEYTKEALDRTHRWAAQCRQYWEQQQRLSVYGKYQALFGIVQGAQHLELRRESAKVIAGLDFDGVAVGGETIGYNMEMTVSLMGQLQDVLPTEKPRYAMGLGNDPQNLIDAVMAGFDMFDCVAPTRLARNGAIYSGKLEMVDGQPEFVSEFPKARINIGNSVFAKDSQTLLPGCDCSTCRFGYTRAYLHHLYKCQELTYYRLASIHNVRLMVRLTEQLRQLLIEQ